MPKFNGSDLKVYAVTGASPGVEALITETTSSSISFATETIATATKDNNGWVSFLPGLRSGTISIDAAVDFQNGAGTTNYDELLAAKLNRTILRLRFKSSTTVAGSAIITVDAVCDSLDMTAGMEEMATFTATFQISGAPTVTAVAP